MKRRFAEGEYRGALELAEQVLAMNPEDAIAEAIAVESRHELETHAISVDVEELDEDELESEHPSSNDPSNTPVSSATLQHSAPLSSRTAHPTAPPVSIQDMPVSEAVRPTAPPGISRSSAAMAAVRVPTPAAPTFDGVDEVDDGWDAVVSESFSADATVAIRGITTRLAAIDVDNPESPQSLARQMYEHFVDHRYEQALELAERILLAQPSERLALAIQSQSQTALARMRAIVVLAVPPADLPRRALDARTQSVLSWVDGTRSVSEIAEACRMEISEVLAILDDLREGRIIVLGGAES